MSSLSRSFWSRQFFEGAPALVVSRLWSAYKKEFFAFFSPATVAWLLDRGDRKLVFGVCGHTRELRFLDEEADALASPISAQELLASSVEAALARRGVARDAAKIVLEIPRDAFFLRRFDIPVSAEASLPMLLVADIERKTPFRVSDVVYGHVLTRKPETAEKYGVQLWILRRDIVMRAIEGTGIDWNDLDFVTPERASDDREGAPTIALGRHVDASQWFRNVVIGLGTLTIVFLAMGLATLIWRQDHALAGLDAEIAAVSARASDVRKIADQAVSESRLLAILREERTRGPALADLWEEVSRILPDGAYLTEFRLSEAKSGERDLDLVGFADSAVGLPALFDKSSMFSDATLTAPITPNAQEKREAFSLRCKVKQQNVADSK
jgi:general secretion pathway protein L